jgi:hypothetical protein
VLFRLDQLPSQWDIAQNIEGSRLAPVAHAHLAAASPYFCDEVVEKTRDAG